MKTMILFFAAANYKIQLPCGRTLKPRPYNYRFFMFCKALGGSKRRPTG